MNQNQRESINKANADRFKSNLKDQMTMIEMLERLYADLSQEPDDESLSWIAAALFSANTALTLAKDCVTMITSEQYEIAGETFYLVVEQYDRFLAHIDQHHEKAHFVVTTNADDLLALEQQVHQISLDLATWHSDQPETNALMLALENVLKQATESIVIGQGQPEQMFTETKIEAIVQSLISQIMAPGSATSESMAREMVEQVLGTTVEERRAFLMNDGNTRGMLQSVNVQAGAALSAVGEVALAQSLATLLRNHLQSDPAKVAQ